MDRAQLDALFATPLDDGTQRGHLYVVGWLAHCPQTITLALWEGGPRAEIYAACEMQPDECEVAGYPWRVLLNISRAAWERWKRRRS